MQEVLFKFYENPIQILSVGFLNYNCKLISIIYILQYSLAIIFSFWDILPKYTQLIWNLKATN